MRSPTFCVVVFTVALNRLALTRFAPAPVLLCDNDTDCEDGFTCQEHICRNCVNCSTLFRKGNICVTDFDDCGNCLEGYEEILLTQFSGIVKPCTPKKEVTLKNCTSDYDCPSNGYCNEGLCVECFDCNLINRLQFGNCTKGQDKCGPCFTGFEKVPAEDQSDFTCEEDVCALCHREKESKDLTDILNLWLLVLIASCIILLIFFCWRDVKEPNCSVEPSSTSKKFVESTQESPTVLNIESTQESPTVLNIESTQESPTVLNIERQDLQQPSDSYYHSKERDCGTKIPDSLVLNILRQDLQQTKVFQLPSASYYHSKEEPDSSSPSGDNEKTSQNLNVPSVSSTETCEDASGRLLVDVITSSNELSGHKPALDTQGGTHVTQGTRISAKEGPDDLPRNQNQDV